MSITQLPQTPNVGNQVPNDLWKWLIEMGNRIRAVIDWVNSYKAPTIPDAVPTGAIIAFPSASIPTGWLVCEGQEISRTTYSALFAVIGTGYGTGDGSTTFRLPDYRGVFLRGNDNGRGYDAGRTLGSYQSDDNKEHTHLVGINVNTLAGGGVGIYTPYNYPNIGAVQTSPSGGEETRPKNVSVAWCIKT